MTAETTPADGAVTIRQDRRKLALAALGALGFVVLGAAFIAHPDLWATARDPRDTIEIVGWASTGFFALALAAIVLALMRPTTVRLAPDGLIIVTALRSYARPWTAVSGFRIGQVRRTRFVVFDDADPPIRWLAGVNRRLIGATSSLPTSLSLTPEQLLTAVQAAKARWG